MKKIIVLGSGCSNCKKTFNIIQKAVAEYGFKAEVIKDESIHSLLKYGVISTPAVVIDENIVLAGIVPTPKDVEMWFNRKTSNESCL